MYIYSQWLTEVGEKARRKDAGGPLGALEKPVYIRHRVLLFETMWSVTGADALRGGQIIASSLVAIVFARGGIYRTATAPETEALSWACSSFSVASIALVVVMVASRIASDSKASRMVTLVLALVAQALLGYAAGTILMNASVAVSRLSFVTTLILNILSAMAIIFGLFTVDLMQESARKVEMLEDAMWRIALTVLAVLWGTFTGVISGVMDAVPSNDVVNYAKTAGWTPGDGDFILWANKRVRAVRVAGVWIFALSVVGSGVTAAACCLSMQRNWWPYLVFLSMSIAAVAIGALAPSTSIVQAVHDSTRLKPFPAYTGNATDAAFLKFSEEPLVDVELWGMSEQWYLAAVGVVAVHGVVLFTSKALE